MPLQYYSAPESFSSGSCLLDRQEAHHLLHVARLTQGSRIQVFDGVGHAYEAEISGGTDEQLSCKILRELQLPKPPLRVKLCFAPVSRTAVELLLDQCTQLGAAAFQPIETERCVSRLEKSWDKKTERWRALLLASCKQSGRADIPQLLPPSKLNQALKDGGALLIASTEERQLPLSEGLRFLREKNPGLAEVSVFVGPEGGFSGDEIKQALSTGAISVSLGNNVLRTETACAAACAQLLCAA